MLRKIIGAIAGLLAAMFIISVTESLNAKLYPLPKGIDIADRQAMQVYISSLPKTALIIVLAGWAIASFVCGLITRIISRSDDKTPAYLAGLLLMTAGIVNMFSYEHPLWFVIIGILIFIPLTLYGFTLIRKRY